MGYVDLKRKRIVPDLSDPQEYRAVEGLVRAAQRVGLLTPAKSAETRRRKSARSK